MAILQWLTVFVILLSVNYECVESEARTCYFGPPPEPSPGEQWVEAAVREIRTQCPGADVPSDERLGDCQALRDAGIYTTEGVQTIYPPQYPDGLRVYCYNSWIRFHRRLDGSVNFTRNWTAYRDGFGELTGEFWLGNEKLRRLTEDGEWQLQVRLEDAENNKKRVAYTPFRVTGDNYTLLVGTRFLGNLDDSLSESHNNQSFSTYDRDNDADAAAKCAGRLKGGWWFKTCTGGYGDLVQSNLNGEYFIPVDPSGQNNRGMRWDGWTGKIVKSEMGLRRKP